MFLKLFCKEQSAFRWDCLNSVFISKNFLAAADVLYLRNLLVWASNNTWTVIFTASNTTGPCRTPVGSSLVGSERRGARRRPGSIILETALLAAQAERFYVLLLFGHTFGWFGFLVVLFILFFLPGQRVVQPMDIWTCWPSASPCPLSTHEHSLSAVVDCYKCDGCVIGLYWATCAEAVVNDTLWWKACTVLDPPHGAQTNLSISAQRWTLL